MTVEVLMPTAPLVETGPPSPSPIIQPPPDWWRPEYGFFGPHYLEGDDSVQGYLDNRKQSLQERTETEVNGVVDLLGLQPGQRVLDMPCGYGRHSIELARRGMDVTGMDINPVHLQRARTKADLTGASPRFVEGNMLELNSREEYDAVINMFYSFGFFPTDEENLEVLRNFFRSLQPDRRFLMHTDVNVPRILSGKYKVDETRRLTSGNALRIIDNYNPDTRRIDGSWIILQDGQPVQRDYSVRVYTREEFTNMCTEVGFQEVTAYGDWDGTPYSHDTEDMIIVARKGFDPSAPRVHTAPAETGQLVTA